MKSFICKVSLFVKIKISELSSQIGKKIKKATACNKFHEP